MTVPLTILAVCALLLGLLSTPAWPWLHTYLSGEAGHAEIGKFLVLALLSTLVVGSGIAAGWYLYRRPAAQDPLDARAPGFFAATRARFWVDEAYDASFLRFARWTSLSIARFEQAFFVSIPGVVGLATLGIGWLSRVFDNFILDLGFDRTCRTIAHSASAGSKFQNGRIQTYLQTIALTVAVLVLVLAWGCKGP